MHHVCIHDLAFARVPYTGYSTDGVAYVRWARAGMPKIPQTLVTSTFFLFKDAKEAEEGSKPGGTGFIVAVPSDSDPDGQPYYYGVTCQHVACVGGFSCIRLNKRDGSTSVLEFDPSEWHIQPAECGDIAACMMDFDEQQHETSAIPVSLFLNRDFVDKNEIGVGEDVFMVGLFADIDRELHKTRNNLMARFGNISMMPNRHALIRTTGAVGSMEREYFILDMHSREGYSGSPVFVFRSGFADLTEGAPMTRTPGGKVHILKLLGLHCGQFRERWEIEEDDRLVKSEGVTLDQLSNKLRLRGLSGMTMAAPAWDVRKLLYSERLQQERASLDGLRPPGVIILE